VKLELICHTPDVETLIATAMFTTTSGAQPSTLYKRLKNNPKKARRAVGRLELQHGSILEHNRFTWALEATEGEVLRIILENRFFIFTPIGESKWLMSANLRTILEYSENKRDGFGDALVDSVRELAPSLKALRGRKE
jgi:hypothetical protein